jgi:hypothetical protein
MKYHAITFTDLNGDKQWHVVQAATVAAAQEIVKNDKELECKRIDFIFISETPILCVPTTA